MFRYDNSDQNGLCAIEENEIFTCIKMNKYINKWNIIKQNEKVYCVLYERVLLYEYKAKEGIWYYENTDCIN